MRNINTYGQLFCKLFATLGFLSATCISLSVSVIATEATNKADYKVETITDKLDQVFGLALLPGGDILVSERENGLRLISNGQLQPEPVSGVPPFYVGMYGGLIDVVLHPRFSENSYIYLTLVKGTYEANSLHVVRGKYSEGHLEEAISILKVFPTQRNTVNYSGRMAFLPDETLLVAVGDGFIEREEAQKLDGMRGKILRIKDDGSVPGDNPFVGRDGVVPEIWSYGHRNMLGLLYDPVTETVYAHENGPMGGDELNIIKPGANYGWPFATYGGDYSGAYVSPYKNYPGTEAPLIDWTPSLAPSGFAKCRNCQWTKWKNDLFVGMLRGKEVRRIRIRGGVVVEQESLFQELGERIRSLHFGADGALYILTDNHSGHIDKPFSRLLKIHPTNNR